MKLLVRTVRVVALLVAVVGVPLAVASVAGQVSGDRVYLLNSTNCVVAAMSQHEGVTVKPGESALLKPGFLARTPTMILASGPGIWIGGLHFSIDRVEVRHRADVEVPEAWRTSSFLGTTITLELFQDQLRLTGTPAVQPKGFPIMFRPGACRSVGET
jgi:hypothetical protein